MIDSGKVTGRLTFQLTSFGPVAQLSLLTPVSSWRPSALPHLLTSPPEGLRPPPVNRSSRTDTGLSWALRGQKTSTRSSGRLGTLPPLGGAGRSVWSVPGAGTASPSSAGSTSENDQPGFLPEVPRGGRPGKLTAALSRGSPTAPCSTLQTDPVRRGSGAAGGGR